MLGRRLKCVDRRDHPEVREGDRTVNMHALIATGVKADGHREILGLDVATAEDGAGWLAFLRAWTPRPICRAAGLPCSRSAVPLVTSDCHRGLRDVIAAVLPAASWQCRRAYCAKP